MQNIPTKMMKRSIIVGVMMFFTLFKVSCATFKTPDTIDEFPMHERALTSESNGIRVSAAVLGNEEARQTFGIDLATKEIQAVWVEIENNTDRPIFLLPTAIDPEYFAPLEVAYAYHKAFAANANAALNEHLLNLNFPIRSPVVPGSRVSGYIFTNSTMGMKVIDVDLLGDDFSQNFTFFARNPDSMQGPDAISLFGTMYSAQELKKIEDEDELRQVLELLPCCVSIENGGPVAEPLNVVIIGALDDWTTAFLRRGYVHHLLNPRYAFGRTQGLAAKKQSRGYTKAQNHTIRFWLTPIRYRDKPVWVAQTSVRLGGRFAEITSDEMTLPLDPHVDEARYDLIQDMAYSQALLKIGFIKGAGKPQSPPAEKLSEGMHYTTDGLRVVLVFADRPASLGDIDFFDWERLAE